MSSLEFNFNIAAASSRADGWQNLGENSGAGPTSMEVRVANAYDSHQPIVPPITPHSEPVNFFKAPNVNSHIISFLDTKGIASIIRLVNKQAKEAARDALRIQLSTKTRLTFKEMVDYQRSLGLADPAAVLHLCVNQKGESNLTQLDLANSAIDDTLLNRFVALCPNLTSLNLPCCDQLTDEGLRRALAQCPNLTSLDLSCCDRFTAEGLRALALCPNLTSLNLLYFDHLTDEELKTISARLPNLTSLNLSQCDQLTDEGLKAIAANCRNLTSLDLSGCNQLTNEGLRALAIQCFNLTSLNLSRCRQLTDVGLVAIVAHCCDLTSLDLSGCYRITDAGLKVIGNLGHNLTHLGLLYSFRITNAGLKVLLAECPRLRIIHTELLI